MSNESTVSFDRMRGMLIRAAEIRDSEQQQIFDSLDEIHARLAALDALGTVRKRLTELPDRTEVGVLAERLDEAIAKLVAQDVALASVLRAVESVPDRLAKPIAALDGRLDGMAGRLEGVSGRMEGLDDRLGGLHKRLDDLDNRLDRHEVRLDAMPTSVGAPIKDRIDGIERTVREQLDGATRSLDETGVVLHRKVDALAARLDSLEEGVGGRLGRLDAALVERPDSAALGALVERANLDSEQRNAGQLDEAMATFAELILGRGASAQSPPPPPRPTSRRPRSTTAVRSANGVSAADTVTDDPDE